MIDQEDLTIFAEQKHCKECLTNPCEIFTSGDYDKCPSLVSAFEKATSGYHAFMNSVQKRHTPGKCVFCREEEMDDRDKDYTLTTLRNLDGTIRMRGYLCSYHCKKEWV